MKLLFWAGWLLFCLTLLRIIYLFFQDKAEYTYGLITGNAILLLVSFFLIRYAKNKIKK